ncbi:hypothetical protein HK100_008655, partial [Physocladia obscura]
MAATDDGTTTGIINYISASVTAPYTYLYTPTNGDPVNNHTYEATNVEIAEIGGLSAEERRSRGFTTDEAGFEVVDGFDSGPADGAAWTDDAWITSAYYGHIDGFFRRAFGATQTAIFDHTVRRRRTPDTAHLPDTPDARKPVAVAHCDQSTRAGQNRVLRHLGAGVHEAMLAGRVRVRLVNVWRPLGHAAVDSPLAVADARSVAPGDWRVQELRYPTWSGETLLVAPNPAHRWYYYRAMPPDAAILLTCFDSMNPH